MFKRIMGLIVVLLMFCLIPAMVLAQEKVFTNDKGVKIYIPNPAENAAYTFTWDGKVVNGFTEGTGVLELYKDGKIDFRYEGNMREGKRHGKGVYKWVSGDIYEGNWIDNKMNGKGIFRWANGDIYEGNWVDDKMSGKGIYKWTDGNIYEGDFANNERHGKGIYKRINGNIYEGDWVNGKRTGKGIYKWPSGTTYVGDFVNGDFHGKGIYKFADGRSYEGNYVNDKRHGWGVEKSSDGKITYEGEWINGKKKTDIEREQNKKKTTETADEDIRYIFEKIFENPQDFAKKHLKPAASTSNFDRWVGEYGNANKIELVIQNGKVIYSVIMSNNPRAFDIVRPILVNQYGQPRQEKRDGAGHNLKWVSGDFVIDLTNINGVRDIYNFSKTMQGIAFSIQPIDMKYKMGSRY